MYRGRGIRRLCRRRWGSEVSCRGIVSGLGCYGSFTILHFLLSGEAILFEAVGAWGYAQVAGQQSIRYAVDEVGLCEDQVLEFVFCFHLFDTGASFALGIVSFEDEGTMKVEFGEQLVCFIKFLPVDGVCKTRLQGFDDFQGWFLCEEAFYRDDNVAFLHEPGGSFFSRFLSYAADEAFFDEVDAVGDLAGFEDGCFLFEFYGEEVV